MAASPRWLVLSGSVGWAWSVGPGETLGIWRPRRGRLQFLESVPFLEASSRSPSASFFLTPAWAKALVPLVGGGGMSMALPPWRRRPGFAGVWMVLLCLLRTRRRRSALCYPSYPRGFRLVPAFFSFRLGVWLSSGGGEVVATQRMWCFAPSCLSCQPAMSIRLYGEHSAFRRCGALQARARR
ncbi:hypothetical protein VPH35_130893 [Triticum aestivum]